MKRAWTGLFGAACLMVVTALTGCHPPQQTGIKEVKAPIMPVVLPAEAPGNLERPAGAKGPLLTQHTDGLLYVSGLSEAPEVGDGLVLRYGGEWFRKAGKRPQIGFVKVARVFGDKSALVIPEYLMPGAEFRGAQVESWDKPTPPVVGKGLGSVTALTEDRVELSLNGTSGVQIGDRYALLAPSKGAERLGHRLRGFVTIHKISKQGSLGRLSRSGGPGGEPAVGDGLLFIGPGAIEGPLPGSIQVSKPLGGDAALQTQIVKALTSYLSNAGINDIRVEGLDVEVDPLSPVYGKDLARLSFVESPRMLLSPGIVEIDGEKVLVFNYTSTGLSVAHSMIAATPEKGLIAGPISDLSARSLSPVFHNTVAAALTHRGQTDQAIHLLEVTLSKGGWEGPNRWHARDQLAMRWSQANQNWEVLRTVQQDVAHAQAKDDKAGVINAVGTLMPVYEEIGMMDLSLVESERFYNLRKALGDGPHARHAWRAFIETLYKAGKTDEAEAELAKLATVCEPSLKAAREAASRNEAPSLEDKSCLTDLYYSLMTFYWYSPRGSDVRRDYLGRAVELAEYADETNMGSIRMTQAMESLASGDQDGALIGLLEARRLYKAEGYTPGVARVDQLAFNLHLARGERQQAYDVAMSAADKYARMHDIKELIDTYRTVTRLYVNVPRGDMTLAAYARAAHPTMSEALRLQFAGDDLGAAAEVFFVSGRFRLADNPEQAQSLLERACELALKTTRFDIASMSRLTIAMLSRAQGDGAAFRSNIELAKEYARITGDAGLLQNVIQVEQGSFEPPTTL